MAFRLRRLQLQAAPVEDVDSDIVELISDTTGSMVFKKNGVSFLSLGSTTDVGALSVHSLVSDKQMDALTALTVLGTTYSS
eukprot:2505860-Pleurochrysis_carterae.AAC.5